jgi:hypothetical protein
MLSYLPSTYQSLYKIQSCSIRNNFASTKQNEKKCREPKIPTILITEADLTDERKDEESCRYFSYSDLTQWMRRNTNILLLSMISLFLILLSSGFIR